MAVQPKYAGTHVFDSVAEAWIPQEGTAGGGAVVAPVKGATVDSIVSAIATGGAALEAFSANPARTYLLIQNTSLADLRIDFGSVAVLTEPSIRLVAGQSITYESLFVPNQSVSIIGASTGQTFVAKEA